MTRSIQCASSQDSLSGTVIDDGHGKDAVHSLAPPEAYDMHSFVHRHVHSSLAAETHGRVLDLGWRYDLMTWFCDTFLLRGKLTELRRKTIRLADLQPGDRVLDVGCGTGTLAIEAQKHLGPSGRVFGIDPGAEQVARARAKATRLSPSVSFQVGVIERLDFPDNSFDAVLSTIMFHHLPKDLKRQGLDEMARVLKPGGRLVIADFDRPYASQRLAAPDAAGQFTPHPLASLVGSAGLADVQVQEMPLPRLPGLPSPYLFSQGVSFIKARKGGEDSTLYDSGSTTS
jgi:ubiquinone/menaquinone biosynthesis C-methylase UbiE